MVNYGSNIQKVPVETILFLQELDKKCAGFIQNILKKDTYRAIKVEYQLTLSNCKDNNRLPYSIEHNASLALKYSNSLVSQIDEYIGQFNKDIAGHIDSKQQIIISLKFSPKEDKRDDTSSLAFIPVKGRYTFDQVILPLHVKKEIEEALNVIHYQKLIYKDWGFEAVDPIPKSVLNFYGPPGTGKTMCAHAIANLVGKKLLALNYAEIESKYVGEAPKNLMKAFDVAKQEDCILFFDEADSFLGKRIQNVTQGAEQALNSLRSQMLILLEEFSGIVIFATNLVTNFDKAFESRILKHIKFDLPDADARNAIIRSMLPKELPVSRTFTDDEFLEMSNVTEDLGGREIKNAILDAMLAKATKEGEKSVFTATDFISAFKERKEMLKRLKEEAQKEKKEKIMKALAKSPVLQEDESTEKGDSGNVAGETVGTSDDSKEVVVKP